MIAFGTTSVNRFFGRPRLPTHQRPLFLCDAQTRSACKFHACVIFILPNSNGGAAAADPSQKGQRWKKKMEATNLRAAREVFRERNPLVRVGYTTDNVSVLKVMTSLFPWTFFGLQL